MQQQQHHQPYVDRRRSGRLNHTNKTTSDDFYTKLERIRLSAAAASSARKFPQRTATELLAESKAFFVKSQEVLHGRQTLAMNFRLTPSFRTPQPRRCPYQDQSQSDPSSPSSCSPTTNTQDGAFESVSVLSLSDQTTLESANSPTQRKRTVVRSSVTIIERNARIIKWLFQLHKANESPYFPCS